MANDRDLLREIASAVLVECPQLFAQLANAIETHDVGTARRAAHTILGNMRALNVKRVMEQASIVEACAKTGDFAAITAPLAELRRQADQVYAEINAMLALD